MNGAAVDYPDQPSVNDGDTTRGAYALPPAALSAATLALGLINLGLAVTFARLLPSAAAEFPRLVFALGLGALAAAFGCRSRYARGVLVATPLVAAALWFPGPERWLDSGWLRFASMACAGATVPVVFGPLCLPGAERRRGLHIGLSLLCGLVAGLACLFWLDLPMHPGMLSERIGYGYFALPVGFAALWLIELAARRSAADPGRDAALHVLPGYAAFLFLSGLSIARFDPVVIWYDGGTVDLALLLAGAAFPVAGWRHDRRVRDLPLPILRLAGGAFIVAWILALLWTDPGGALLFRFILLAVSFGLMACVMAHMRGRFSLAVAFAVSLLAPVFGVWMYRHLAAGQPLLLTASACAAAALFYYAMWRMAIALPVAAREATALLPVPETDREDVEPSPPTVRIPSGMTLGERLTAQFARHGLTARESEVAALLLQGASTTEISRRLFISEHTTRTHIKRILAKFGAPSRDAFIAKTLAEEQSGTHS